MHKYNVYFKSTAGKIMHQLLRSGQLEYVAADVFHCLSLVWSPGYNALVSLYCCDVELSKLLVKFHVKICIFYFWECNFQIWFRCPGSKFIQGFHLQIFDICWKQFSFELFCRTVCGKFTYKKILRTKSENMNKCWKLSFQKPDYYWYFFLHCYP